MKIHLHKEQTNEKTSLAQIIGLSRPTKCYEILTWFEVTEEEREVINKSPDLLKRKIFDYGYSNLDLSPSVESMIEPPKQGEKGHRFMAYTSDDFFALENKIVGAAKVLKSHIEGLKGSEGSSTIEI